MRLGVGAAEIVPARADLADGVHGLPRLAHVDAGGEAVQDAELVGIHDVFLVGGDQPALEPAAGMQHEVDPGEEADVERVGALVAGLRIGQLGAAEGAGAAEGQPEPAGELAGAEGDLRRLGRAEGRRPRIHVDRGDEGAEDHRRARADQLRIGDPGQHLGQHLGQRAGDRDRRHGAADDEGRDDRRLVGRGIDLERAHHGAVEGQRRVDVDEARHHRVRLEEVRAEQQPRHLDAVGGALGRGDAAHIGLVAEGHVRQQHVEMALVDRHVGRLADRAAGMVQPFRFLAELHQVAEILDRGVAPPALEVAHEGRAVDRGEDQVAAADLDIAGRVARGLGELARRRRAEAAGEALRHAHALALHVGPGLPPALERGRVVGEVDADLLQHGLGIGLDDLERLGVQDLEIGDVALDEMRGLVRRRAALRPPRRAAAAPPPSDLVHGTRSALPLRFAV